MLDTSPKKSGNVHHFDLHFSSPTSARFVNYVIGINNCENTDLIVPMCLYVYYHLQRFVCAMEGCFSSNPTIKLGGILMYI